MKLPSHKKIKKSFNQLKTFITDIFRRLQGRRFVVFWCEGGLKTCSMRWWIQEAIYAAFWFLFVCLVYISQNPFYRVTTRTQHIWSECKYCHLSTDSSCLSFTHRSVSRPWGGWDTGLGGRRYLCIGKAILKKGQIIGIFQQWKWQCQWRQSQWRLFAPNWSCFAWFGLFLNSIQQTFHLRLTLVCHIQVRVFKLYIICIF